LLNKSAPSAYERTKTPAQPKLDSHKLWIDEILELDKKCHPKQRHTALRIYHRLKKERAYSGCYSTVRTYIA
jgi:hypothetical protein